MLVIDSMEADSQAELAKALQLSHKAKVFSSHEAAGQIQLFELF